MNQGQVLDTAPSESASATPSAVAVPDDLAGVIAAYETPLLRYVRHLGGVGDADAEDVVQEAFLRYHNYVERNGTDGVRDLARWLFRVTHNLALDFQRRKASRARAQEGARRAAELESKSSPEGLTALVRRAACERALEELQKLTPQQKQVLLLKVIQEMKMRDIAAVTGMTLGNVAYHLSQALKELARRLKAAGVI
jgi:RNA polymerase sigma-70 factor (ECF subfamily)